MALLRRWPGRRSPCRPRTCGGPGWRSRRCAGASGKRLPRRRKTEREPQRPAPRPTGAPLRRGFCVDARMSAVRGKADVVAAWPGSPLLAKSGNHPLFRRHRFSQHSSLTFRQREGSSGNPPLLGPESAHAILSVMEIPAWRARVAAPVSLHMGQAHRSTPYLNGHLTIWMEGLLLEPKWGRRVWLLCGRMSAMPTDRLCTAMFDILRRIPKQRAVHQWSRRYNYPDTADLIFRGRLLARSD